MILIGGENLIDYIQEPEAPGHPLYRAIPGGSPYNVAKAVARQGAATGYLTPISSDSLGMLLSDDLSADGVTLLGGVSDKPTSLAVVSLQDGQARYQFYREATAERDLDLPLLTAAIPAEAEAFHIGSLALTDGSDAEAWEALFGRLHQRELFCSIDPNVRPAFVKDRAAYLDRLERLYQQANLIKLSDEDLSWLAPDQPLNTAQEALFERSTADVVVLTKGAEGARAICAAGAVEVPPEKVANLVDTVGAGDTFMATLLAECCRQGLHQNLGAIDLATARKLLETAARAAAINCGRKGCNPPTALELHSL